MWSHNLVLNSIDRVGGLELCLLFHKLRTNNPNWPINSFQKGWIHQPVIYAVVSYNKPWNPGSLLPTQTIHLFFLFSQSWGTYKTLVFLLKLQLFAWFGVSHFKIFKKPSTSINAILGKRPDVTALGTPEPYLFETFWSMSASSDNDGLVYPRLVYLQWSSYSLERGDFQTLVDFHPQTMKHNEIPHWIYQSWAIMLFLGSAFRTQQLFLSKKWPVARCDKFVDLAGLRSSCA